MENSIKASGNHQPVHVVALALRDAAGRVLVQQRPDHKHQGGLWEFPGGKVEPGESPLAALRREIHEELDYTLGAAGPLIQVTHDYPDKSVRLEVWQAVDPQAAARLRPAEGQPIRWVGVDALRRLPMPAADRPVVNALRLPDHYWITPFLPADGVSAHRASSQAIQSWLRTARSRLDSGVRMVQFRSKTIPETNRALLLKALYPWCREKGVALIYNGEVGVGRAMLDYGIADGLHLSSAQLMALRQRPVDDIHWLSASVHNEEELHQARKLEVDFVSLSPVRATQSHPQAQPLGWERFAELARQAHCPVYALGGMALADVSAARAAGGQGVAGITLPARPKLSP